MGEQAKPKSVVGRVFDIAMAILYAIAGYYFLTHPIASLNVAAAVFVVFFMAAGLMEVIHFFINRKEGVSVWMLLIGVLNVLLGIYLLSSAYNLFAFLPFMMAFWAMFVGFGRIGFAFTQKKANHQWISSLIAGIAMIILGIFMFNNPVASILTVSLLFAIGMWVMAVNNLIEAFSE